MGKQNEQRKTTKRNTASVPNFSTSYELRTGMLSMRGGKWYRELSWGKKSQREDIKAG